MPRSSILPSVLLGAALLLRLTAAALGAPLTVIVNDEKLHALSRQVNGVLYVSAFAVARALGCQATYDPRGPQVSIDGHPLPSKPQVWDDTVYVPAREVARAAHAILVVDNAKSEVRLASVLVFPVANQTPTSPSTLAVQPAQTAPPPAAEPTALDTPHYYPTNVPGAIPVQAAVPTITSPPTVATDPFVPRPPPDINASRPGQFGQTTFTPPPTLSAPPPMLAAPPTVYAPPPPPPVTAPPAQAEPNPIPFQPRTGSNGTFAVTVTNVELIPYYHSHFQPRAGYKFEQVSVSEQNISPNAQVYTGKFELQDTGGSTFEVQDGLSNFWPVVLTPQGTNFGYLTFEIPESSTPGQLLLQAESQPVVSVNLQ